MNAYHWADSYRECYDKSVLLYRLGNRKPATYFSQDELEYLQSIGCSAQELYDFAEDWCRDEAPSYDTALLITAARRDFFWVVQAGKSTGRTLAEKDFPAKDAELAGIKWLPRLLLKARAKLRGELPDSLMYCCGGDRAFLRKHNIHPADFLRIVWAAREDDQVVLEALKQAT